MKKVLSLIVIASMLFTSLCASALDVNEAYNDFKNAHPEFIESLTTGGISEEKIISFINDVYDYLLEINEYTPVTAENFEQNAMRAITDVSSREAYYSLQDTLLILYPDAIRLAVTEGKVSPEFQPLVETIKKILFSENNNTISGGSNTSGGHSGESVTEKPTIQAQLFTDLAPSHWAYESVSFLAENFILNGYLDGSFMPDNKITRAEFAKIIISATNKYDTTAKSEFYDVSSDEWYYSYVSSAYKMGLITGYPDGSFHPDDNITRADICTIVNRVLRLSPDGSASAFTDDYSIPSYARDAVYALAAKKIVSGNPDGSFMPTEFATRAQTAKIVYAGLLGSENYESLPDTTY